MTTPEHLLVGCNVILTLGLHRRYGWKLPAIAAVAAAAPDWDGITILGGLELFDRAHRVWGHGLLSCVILALLLGTIDYRFDFVTRIGRLLARKVEGIPPEAMEIRNRFTWKEYGIWIGICFLAALTHLFCDMIVSGNAQFPDWPVQLFWPFSTRGYVYPLLQWGDAVPTIILISGVVAMFLWKKRISLLAASSLLCLGVYAIVF